jgi:SAM-dependent methyltransferase
MATGIDLSEPMLEVARRRRETSGLTNVSFVAGDAQTHTFAGHHDVAISRFGTMFFADPTAAFANIALGLRLGGRLSLATWQRLAANEWLTIPAAALVRYGTMPDLRANAPGMFTQSEPDTVTNVLASAGYVDIDLVPVKLALTVGADLDDAADYLTRSGVGRLVLETVPDHDRAAAQATACAWALPSGSSPQLGGRPTSRWPGPGGQATHAHHP